ncbi:MAG: hypothetical protein PHU23_15490 [Dehalococcoidales bacterium]|nr:hypothetical protein [Dehalococcoidales bacterium]
MRLPAPEISSDPFFDLIGQRVAVNVDGTVIKGRLLSCRDSFVTIDPDRGARFTVNKYAVTSIRAETRPISRCPKVTKTF